MSDPMPSAETVACPAGHATAGVLESYPAHQATLPGGLVLRRALGVQHLRVVNPA